MAMLEWPRRRWTTWMSAPRRSRLVAYEWRPRCGKRRRPTPASAPARRTTLATQVWPRRPSWRWLRCASWGWRRRRPTSAGRAGGWSGCRRGPGAAGERWARSSACRPGRRPRGAGHRGPRHRGARPSLRSDEARVAERGQDGAGRPRTRSPRRSAHRALSRTYLRRRGCRAPRSPRSAYVIRSSIPLLTRCRPPFPPRDQPCHPHAPFRAVRVARPTASVRW